MAQETFTRKQLYDLVWSESLLALSKKYKLSDNGLRKICLKMDVPLPDSGHWAKLKAGKKVRIKPLSEVYKGKQEISLELRKEGDTSIVGSELAKLQKEIEADQSLNLTVKETLTNPDPLVAKAQKAFKDLKVREDYKSLLYAGWDNLDISVSPGNVNRALCIMDTFIRAMRQKGYDFKVDHKESYLLIGEVKVRMVLREMQTKVIVDEKWKQTDSRPNGILTFRFERYTSSISCTDGKLLIEQQLSKLIAKLELFAEKTKIEIAEQRKRQEEYDEQRRKEQEIADRKKNELNSFKQLMKDARRWNEAENLRKYINKVEQTVEESGNLTEEVISWLEWAKKKTDWFDPLVNASDEWLVNVNPNDLLENNKNNNEYNRSFYSDDYSSQKTSWPVVPWYVKNRR